MIIRNKKERMRFFSSFQILSFILLAIFINSGCFFVDNRQMTINNFEPFTLKENILLFRRYGYNHISIIDTDKDEIIRRIKVFSVGPTYAINVSNKIYVMDSGLPIIDSYTICVIYPEKGTYKSILLDYPLPSSLMFNPVSKKVVVEHGSVFNDSQAEKRGGIYPISVINTENDTFEKTLWFWSKFYFEQPARNGNFIFSEYGNGICKIGLLDVNTKETNLIDINFNSGGEGSWSEFEHSGSKVFQNKLFFAGLHTNMIKVYDTDTRQLLYSITISNYPFTNYLQNCIDYYPDSNLLFVGGNAICVIDLNKNEVVKWITNYKSKFKISNHKLYILIDDYDEDKRIDVLSITNNFKLIKTFKYSEL